MTTQEAPRFETGEDFLRDFRSTCMQIVQVDPTEAALLNSAIEHGRAETVFPTDRLIAAAGYYIERTQHADFADLMRAWRDRTNAAPGEVVEHIEETEVDGNW